MRREIHKFEHRRTFAKVALLLRVAKNTKTNNHNTRDEEEEEQLLSLSLFLSPIGLPHEWSRVEEWRVPLLIFPWSRRYF